MKKLATLTLVLALCVSMTGCGKNNKEAIKNAVIKGRGIAVMSAMLIKRELGAGELVTLELDELPIRRTLHLIHHKNKYITPAIAAFTEICKNYK